MPNAIYFDAKIVFIIIHTGCDSPSGKPGHMVFSSSVLEKQFTRQAPRTYGGWFAGHIVQSPSIQSLLSCLVGWEKKKEKEVMVCVGNIEQLVG